MLSDLLLSQVTDVFRIGLIIGLVYTMSRTAAVTGRVIPLLLGVVFVAVILPATMPNPTVSQMQASLVGLLSNGIILLAVLGVARLITRFRR